MTERIKSAGFRALLVAGLFCALSFSVYAQSDAAADAGASDQSSAVTAAVDESNTVAPTEKEMKKIQKAAEKEAKKRAKEEKKALKEAAKNAKKTTKNTKNAAGQKSAAAKADASEEGQAVAAEETKNFTGWIKAKKKNVKETFGNLQVNIKARLGSFSLSVVNEASKEIPILSVSNEYTTNGFYLKSGRKIYSLSTDATISTTILRRTNGTGILYEIPGVAEVILGFDFFPFTSKDTVNVIKVSATVKNKTKRKDEFAIKAILDTILGESAAYHFHTADGVAIKKEVVYRTLQNQKYFVSENDYATMQLFFSGADCTEPEFLAFANYGTLDKNLWEPSMTVLRDFDTVFSYNNSAVCAIWKPVNLAPEETFTVRFYLAAEPDGRTLDVAKYFYKSEKKPAAETKYPEDDLVKELQNRPAATETQRIPADVVPETTVPAVKEMPATETAAAPASLPVAETPSSVSTPDAMSKPATVDFYIKNMTKEQLTQEYIQKLLDRIALLEEDSPSLNRQELLELNAELDAILTYLRQ